MTIVGVAGDVRQFGLDRTPDDQVYLPFFQTEMWDGRLVARAAGGPRSLETQVRETRLLTGLLFEVSPTDAITTALTAAILAFTALAATFFPARRASRMDPVTALRHE